MVVGVVAVLVLGCDGDGANGGGGGRGVVCAVVAAAGCSTLELVRYINLQVTIRVSVPRNPGKVQITRHIISNS